VLIPSGELIIEEFFAWLVAPGPRGSADAIVMAANLAEGWIELHGTPPWWPAETVRVVLIPEAIQRWYVRVTARGGAWVTSEGLLSLVARRDLYEDVYTTVNKRAPGAIGDVIIDDRVL
jgi:hypothetical protein